MSMRLLDDEADGVEKKVQFTINQNYADAYDTWRHKEELQKLKDRYGDDVSKSSSSSDDEEVEDDFGQDLNVHVEKGFLKALSALKSKDPQIYQENAKFYSDSDSDETETDKKTSKKDKPMFLKDYDRKLIVERAGRLSDDDYEEEDKTAENSVDPSYVEQQRAIKESFKAALKDDVEDDDYEFLKHRVKTAEETAKEEEDYLEWLKGRKTELNNSEDVEKMKFLHDYWNDPSLDQEEKFLKDYILNRRYRNDEEDRIPTYEEIVDELDKDEDVLDKQEQFERSYNFRFEEPDQQFIKSYPRTIKDSVRKVDDSRKAKRDALKERKDREKEKRKAEVKQLKALKRKEIVRKIDKLREATGDESLRFDPNDLETDFDPDDYDRKMQALFDDAYYAAGASDEEPPRFSSESDALSSGEESEPDWDRPSASPAKPAPAAQGEVCRKEGKKRKRKSKLAEAVAKPKPLFDPSEKSFAEYIDEYYQLDAEGEAGGQQFRFRYRNVEPNDFGLTVNEVFSASDKELNTWVSLKKAFQYRNEKEEKYDVELYKRKAQDLRKKRLIFPSVFTKSKEESEVPQSEVNLQVHSEEQTSADKKATKKRRRKKRKVAAGVDLSDSLKSQKLINSEDGEKKIENVTKGVKKETPRSERNQVKAKKLKHDKQTYAFAEKMSDERLKAYGVNPKKFRNKLKYRKFDTD